MKAERFEMPAAMRAFLCRHFADEDDTDNATRRRHRRLRPSQVVCDLGRIMDVSLGGLRIRSRVQIIEPNQVTLLQGEKSLVLATSLRWSERVGWRRYDWGLQFLHVNEEQLEALEAIPAAL